MISIRKSSLLAILLLFGAAGCVELDVPHPYAPETEGVVRAASDLEQLIGGSYRQWWNGEWSNASIGPILSVASFQHSAFPANFGMTQYSAIPRVPLENDPAHTFYGQWSWPWTFNYRAISVVRTGFRSLDAGVATLPAAQEQRARAYGRFVQGLAHASLAVLFDSVFVVDETVELTDAQGLPVAQTAQSYQQAMEAALGYFDEAIELATDQTFTIPATWMSRTVTAAQLVQLAHSYKARYRAAVARTPEERAAVNWEEVIRDAERGITADWAMHIEGTNWGAFGSGYYVTQINPPPATPAYGGLWSQMSYFILGMADQSGKYQRWLASPVGDRHPNIGGAAADPFLIITPDLRFPQGSTLAAQRADSRERQEAYYVVPGATGMWGQPGRGTWRWSYYLYRNREAWHRDWATNPAYPWITVSEMRLLQAEGHFHQGRLGDAASLINVTRERFGLSPTDAGGANTSCVPKLPNGQCGDLFEMLKWEKRLETVGQGLFGAPWFFDSRGWGDLYRGTPLHYPIPCRDRQVLERPCYTFGGVGGTMASPGSSYAFPFE